jgi:hypothetical protein
MRPSVGLAPAAGPLKPYPITEFFPVRRIQWTQLTTDRHCLRRLGWRLMQAKHDALSKRVCLRERTAAVSVPMRRISGFGNVVRSSFNAPSGTPEYKALFASGLTVPELGGDSADDFS